MLSFDIMPMIKYWHKIKDSKGTTFYLLSIKYSISK